MKVRRVALAACLAAAACFFILAGIAIHRFLNSTAGVSPPPHITRAGMIDRVVDGSLAVLLVDGEQEELLVPVDELPENARAGDWLILRRDGVGALSLELDPEATATAARRIEAKLRALRERGPKPTSP